MSSGAYAQDVPERCEIPRPTAAWRSARFRRRNTRAALAFWLFNLVLLLSSALNEPWAVLQHVHSA